MLFTALFFLRKPRHFYLLNLRPQFLQGAVTINAVRNVRSKAVLHHPFPVRFPDAVAFTEPAEGVAAGVRRSLRKTQVLQCVLHIPPKLRDALAAQIHRTFVLYCALCH